MATTAYGTNNALAVKVWAKKLLVEALKQTRYAQFKGSSSTDSLVSLRTELNKSAGDRVTIGLRMQLTGPGISGDGTLEGNEEALTTYSDNVFIDQLRHAVRSAGKMSEQRVPFEVRQEAMSGLRDWWSDRLDTSLFNQLCGATVQQVQANTTISSTPLSVYSGLQSAIAPDASHLFITSQSKGAGTLDTTEASLSASTTFSLALVDIDRAVAKAKTITPAIRPISVNGENKYALFIHPYQTYQLRTQTSTGAWQDIQKSQLQGGKIGDNPVITGLLGVYNNTLLVEDARIPIAQSTGTLGGVAASNYRRAVFCGAQAAAIAFGQDNGDGAMKWVEEMFDYENQLGVSSGLIYGCKKLVFNSADFGTLAMTGYAPSV